MKIKIRSLMYESNLGRKIYLFLKSIYYKLRLVVGDEKFAKKRYFKNTGKTLNIDNPEKFNEKLWWLKLNNRDPMLTKCSDKVKVRDYVKDKGLDHILNEVFGVYDNAEDIDFKKLPEKAFIKTNHGSGTNILWDRSKEFDKKAFIEKFNYSLKENYYLHSREWNYKNIEPKIIVEKVLEDEKNKSLIDYRFFCFDGIVKMIFVDIETAAEDGTHNPHAKRNVYDKDFNYLNIKVKREQFDNSLISKPINFGKMIEYAEILSEPFPFCRVDFYNIDGQVIFGEITFYPGGASQLVEPEEWDHKMGDWINLNSDKVVLR